MGETTVQCASQEELDRRGCDIISRCVKDLAQTQPAITLGISGGRSIRGIFSLLKNETVLPWDKVHIFWVDERLVPLNHVDSNYKLGKDLFIDNLIRSGALPAANVHPFDMNKGIDAYNNELAKHGGMLDIVLLGAGEDGHICALFPNNSVKDDGTGYIAVKDSPKPPSDRITISRSTLLRAKVAVLLFVGEAKKDAFMLFSKEGPVEECPARLVKQMQDAHVLAYLR
jgi:6-phosphogluconolactonase